MHHRFGLSHGPPSQRVRYSNIWYGLVFLIHTVPIATARAESSSRSPQPPADTSSASSPSASKLASTVPDPFSKGTRYWLVSANVSHRQSIAWMYFTQISLNYYVADNLAVSAGGMVGYVDAQRAPGGALGGQELGVRWHFAKGPRWSTYVDAGAGAVTQRHPFNDRSLRFNFELLAGGGASYHLKDDLLVLGGVRLQHLSNARIRGKEHNFGYDGTALYLALMQSF